MRRQLEDCRALVAEQGCTIAGEYVDNDRSAHSGTPRPEYDRLLADVADGLLDAVVVWDLDRLHRRPKELEEFIEVCDRAGMKQLKTVQGTGADIGTTDGLFLARIMGAVAANESDKKSQRVKRKMRQNAQAGKPHGGSRAFGYEADKVTIKPDETRIIGDLAARLLAGESLASLARSLQDAEVPTVRGGQWRPSTVRNMLYNARLSGQREHKGQIIGDAECDPIITKAETEKIRALLDDPKRKTTRSARRYLLAGGLLVCRPASAARADAHQPPPTLRTPTRHARRMVRKDYGLPTPVDGLRPESAARLRPPTGMDSPLRWTANTMTSFVAESS